MLIRDRDLLNSKSEKENITKLYGKQRSDILGTPLTQSTRVTNCTMPHLHCNLEKDEILFEKKSEINFVLQHRNKT